MVFLLLAVGHGGTTDVFKRPLPPLARNGDECEFVGYHLIKQAASKYDPTIPAGLDPKISRRRVARNSVHRRRLPPALPSYTDHVGCRVRRPTGRSRVALRRRDQLALRPMRSLPDQQELLPFPQRAPEFQGQFNDIIPPQLGRYHQARRGCFVTGEVLRLTRQLNSRTAPQHFSSIIRYARRCGERFCSGSPPVCSKIGPNLLGLMLTVALFRWAISANSAQPR